MQLPGPLLDPSLKSKKNLLFKNFSCFLRKSFLIFWKNKTLLFQEMEYSFPKKPQ